MRIQSGYPERPCGGCQKSALPDSWLFLFSSFRPPGRMARRRSSTCPARTAGQRKGLLRIRMARCGPSIPSRRLRRESSWASGTKSKSERISTGLARPRLGELDVSPTVKWRPWKSARLRAGRFIVGDDLFFPVRERTFNAGNYFYASFAKEWKHGTRIGLADMTLRERGCQRQSGWRPIHFRAARHRSRDARSRVVYRKTSHRLRGPWRDVQNHWKTHAVHRLPDWKLRRNERQSPVSLGIWL